MSSNTLIICPVFNEGHHLEGLVNEFKHAKFKGELLFVNSGSEDNSSLIIKNSGFKYLSLDKNLGVGNALVQGIRFALDNNYEVVCVIAGNGKMRPKYIDKLTKPIFEEGYDFVQGSRYLNSIQQTMPLFRKILIPIVTKVFSLLFSYKFSDATCGFRAFHINLIRLCSFNIEAKWLRGYAFEPYFFSNVLLDKSVSKKEVSVTMDYPEKNIKYTKIKPLLDYPSLLLPYLYAFIYPRKFNKVD
jgi:dolichol-phosphate mannosyltransferase